MKGNINKVRISFRMVLMAVLVALVAAGCAVEKTVRVKDGQEFCVTEGQFRARWWNYYERGNSCLDGELWADAERDYRKALSMDDKDRRSAVTYGLHLTDYFPHRDLGVALFQTGRYEEAVSELETSLSTVETSKAQYYLDKARKALIEKSGGDTTGPVIKIIYPLAANSVVKDTDITVKAEAVDSGFVGEASVSGHHTLIPVSKGKLEFSAKVELKPGPNEVEIRARDLTGNEESIVITVIRDTEGPQVSIEDFSKSRGQASVKGFIYDTGGIKSFEINGKSLDVPADAREFEFKTKVNAPDGKVAFTAKDTVGNETGGAYPEADESETGSIFPVGPPMFAWNSAFQPLLPKRVRYYLAGSEPLVMAANVPGPNIFIKDIKDGAKIYFDSIYLEGNAKSPAGVVELKAGDKPIVKRLGKSVYFNYLTRLKKGENKLVFTARDSAGRITTKTVNVTRVVPKVHKVGSRFSVSMLPFYLRGDVNLSQIAYDNLLSSMVDGKRFRMLDRSKINAAVRELKLSQAGLTDPKLTVKAGKIVAAEGVLMGIVTEKEKSIEVYARLVDTETGNILAEKDAYHEDKSLKNLKLIMDGLAVKIKNGFPLVEGILVKTDKGKLEASFMSNTVIPGMRVIIFRPGDAKSEKLGADSVIMGEGKITSVKGKTAKVDVNKKGLKVRPEGDIIITK